MTPCWSLVEEHTSVLEGRETSSVLNVEVQIRVCSYTICYRFALDSLCKWVHTLKYSHENVWQDFPSVLALHKHIDIYRLWTTSDNVSLSKRITGNETVLILACVYTWSTLISHVCSEVLKNQGFWHYNLYGGEKRQGWKGDTLFYLINHFNISEGNLSPKP